jgi:hypothetical protein
VAGQSIEWQQFMNNAKAKDVACLTKMVGVNCPFQYFQRGNAGGTFCSPALLQPVAHFCLSASLFTSQPVAAKPLMSLPKSCKEVAGITLTCFIVYVPIKHNSFRLFLTDRQGKFDFSGFWRFGSGIHRWWKAV